MHISTYLIYIYIYIPTCTYMPTYTKHVRMCSWHLLTSIMCAQRQQGLMLWDNTQDTISRITLTHIQARKDCYLHITKICSAIEKPRRQRFQLVAWETPVNVKDEDLTSSQASHLHTLWLCACVARDVGYSRVLYTDVARSVCIHDTWHTHRIMHKAQAFVCRHKPQSQHGHTSW